jgi:hypothetical protein
MIEITFQSFNLYWYQFRVCNVICETTTGKNRKMIGHVGIGNNILDRIPIGQQLIETIDKWDCIKL